MHYPGRDSRQVLTTKPLPRSGLNTVPCIPGLHILYYQQA
jgi:hypothetical protein